MSAEVAVVEFSAAQASSGLLAKSATPGESKKIDASPLTLRQKLQIHEVCLHPSTADATQAWVLTL